MYTDGTLVPTMQRFPSSRSVDCTTPSLLGVRLGLLRGEHKQVVVRRRRIEESAEVYLNINSECGGASGMKDVEARIIVHEEAGTLSAVSSSRSSVLRDS